MAAATPMGKDKSMVTNIVNNEPIIAPLMPQSLKTLFPGVKVKKNNKAFSQLVSKSARYEITAIVINNPDIINITQSLWMLVCSKDH
jgi:hypothetical protein